MPWSLAHAQRFVIAGDGRLYHLTDASNLEGILTNGLRPHGAASQFDAPLVRSDHVYLCTREVATWALDGSFDADWGDAVVSVAALDLDPALVDGDEDYWRGHPAATGFDAATLLRDFPDQDTPDAVLASLLDGGTVAYAGMIPPALLQVELVPVRMRPDVPSLAAIRGPRVWRHVSRRQ